jgi:hypothetical protein
MEKCCIVKYGNVDKSLGGISFMSKIKGENPKRIGELFRCPLYLTTLKEEGDEVRNFEAVTIKTKFHGLQNNLISKIKKPTVILEFKNSEFIQHEPQYLYDHHLSPCNLLKDYCKEKDQDTNRACACIKQDENAAKLFVGLNQKNYIDQIRKKISDNTGMSGIINPRPKRVEDKSKERKIKKRGYIEYQCKMTGYREVVMPIFVYGSILGVLFLGRLRTKESIKSEKKIRKDYFEEIKGELGDEAAEFSAKFLDNEIDININRNILDGIEYFNIIQETVDALENFENELEKTMESNRRTYVREVTKEEINRFYNNYTPISEQKKISESTVDKFWETVRGSIDRINEYLNLWALIVLSDKEMTPSNLNRGNVGVERKEILKAVEIGGDNLLQNIILPLDKVDKKLMSNNFINANKDSMLKLIDVLETTDGNVRYLRSVIHKESSVFVIFPSLTKYGYSMAFLLIFNSTTNNEREIFSNFRESLCELLHPFFLLIFSTLASLHSDFSWEKMNRTLHVYRHEVGHNTAVLTNIHQRFQNLSHFKGDVGFRDSVTHMWSVLKVLSLLNDTTKIIDSIPAKKELTWINLNKDFFSEWADSFNRGNNRQLDLKIMEGYENEFFLIRSNEEYLQHILYNLLSNAFKYAYEGTNIEIKCIKEYKQTIISIVNYGMCIDVDRTKKKLYDLFYRSNMTKIAGITEGNGIGLHVAQKIAKECLETEIKDDCKKVSDFYVPYMQIYLDLNENKNPDTEISVKNELKDLVRRGSYKKIMSQKYKLDVSNDKDLCNRIIETIEKKNIENDKQYKTYRVEFSVKF